MILLDAEVLNTWISTRRFPHPVIAIVVPVGIYLINRFLFMPVFNPSFAAMRSPEIQQALWLVLANICFVLPLVLWSLWGKAKRIRNLGFPLSIRSVTAWLFGGIGAASALGCILLLSLWFLQVSFDTDPFGLGDFRRMEGIDLMFCAWIVQGASEEFAFRGWLLPALSQRFSPALSILSTSLVFAFLHFLNPGFNWMAFVNLIVWGIVTSLMVLYTKSLWAACGFHSVWNFVQGNIMGLRVSGVQYWPMRILTNITGPTLLSGGEFGVEASVLTTVVWCGVGGLMLFLIRRRAPRELSRPFSFRSINN